MIGLAQEPCKSKDSNNNGLPISWQAIYTNNYNLDCNNLFENLGDTPSFRLGDRAAFLDLDQIAFRCLDTRLNVSVILGGTLDHLAVQRELHATLNQNGHGVGHLVADNRLHAWHP